MDINDWEITPKMQQDQPRSEIQEFYKGQSVLLTGITGYLGKCLLQKLLRSCTGIEKIYTIVRPKRNMTVEQRMSQFFDNMVFDSLREEVPNFADKVVSLPGDLSLPGLGLSDEHYRLLVDNVTLIIHNGATVVFLDRISKILRTNVVGTQQLLELAKECPGIKGFLYVSTAYSQSQDMYIEERCYEPPGDLKVVTDIIAADTENAAGITEAALIPLRSHCENNYTFSKATAEGLVESFSRRVNFPCGIFRPSIVIWSVKEPTAGWIGNQGGPVFQYLGYALGVVHVIFLAGDPILDVVPADMTCNGLIASLWDLSTVKKPREKCYVYHYTSSKLNPTSIKSEIKRVNETTMLKPSNRAIWYPSMYFTGNRYVFNVLHFLFHFMPCVFADIYLCATGRKPFVIQKFRHMTQNMDALIKFSTTEYTFEMKHMPDIWDRMNPTDKDIFYSDIRDVQWSTYSKTGWAFLRRHLLNEPDHTIPAARRRIFKLKILHYTVCGFLAFLFFYFLYSLVCRFLGL